MNKVNVFENLKWTLQALGLPANIQIKLFPDFVVVTDELLLEFSNCKEIVFVNFNEDLSNEQKSLLQKLDDFIGDFPKFDSEISDFEILSTSDFFEEIRTFSKEVLKVFKWDLEEPPFDRVAYIRG